MFILSFWLLAPGREMGLFFCMLEQTVSGGPACEEFLSEDVYNDFKTSGGPTHTIHSVF